MMMMMTMGQAGNGGGGEAAASPSGGGEGMAVATRRCEDCGNQAKKECKYKRCRRCCKRKGFHCKTHVTSTWVPAACRRTTVNPLSVHQKTRTTTATTLPLPLPQHQLLHASGLSSSNFPAEVSTMAVFRCCRVSTVGGLDGRISHDDDEEQYAYQTAVRIGGHVFKGILYDQGRRENQQGETASSSTVPLLHQMMMHPQPQQRRQQRPTNYNHHNAAGGGRAALTSAAVGPPPSAYPNNLSLTTTTTTSTPAATQQLFFHSSYTSA